MSLYNNNKRRNQCYDAQNRRWFTCDENTSRREGSSPSPPPPPTCCIPDDCCFDCSIFFDLISCFNTILNDSPVSTSQVTTLGIRELSVLTTLNACPGGLTIEGEVSPFTPPYQLLKNGIPYDCISDVYVTNDSVDLFPGDHIVQCVVFESDCFDDFAICYRLDIVDLGGGFIEGVYSLFRICTNPAGLGNMSQCQNCYQ